MNYTLTVNVAGEPKTITMTLGLLNTLSRLCGDPDVALDLAMDTNLREDVLVEVLSPRDEHGQITDPINPMTIDMSIEDSLELYGWVSEHVVDFFMRAQTRAIKTITDRKEQFESLKSSQAGLQPSAPKKLSA